MSATYLFVYGTLRSDSPKSSPIRGYITRCAEYTGKAAMQGKLYEIEGYPGVVPSNESKDRVVGEVYKISKPENLFPLLDEYEGCSSRFPEPREFVRKVVPVRLENGEEVEAWVYLYAWDVSGRFRIEPGDYAKYLERRIR